MGKRIIVVALAVSLILALAGPAQAKRILGTKGPDRIAAPRRPTWSKVVGATTESRAAVAGIDSSEGAAPTA